MSDHVASFETILESVDTLSATELETLQAYITRSRQKQAPTSKASKGSIFEIPYEEYLKFSETEQEALQ